MVNIFTISLLKTTPHNLSLQGLTGIVFALFNVLIIVLINYFINQFYSGVGPIALMPISFFEFLVVGIGLVYLLISYLLVTKINTIRRKKMGLVGWEKHAIFMRKIFFLQFLAFAFLSFLFMNIGLLKLIIPTSLLLFGVSCIMVSSLTIGYTKVLGYFFILQSLLALFAHEAQFFLWGIAFGGFPVVYVLIHKLQKKSI